MHDNLTFRDTFLSLARNTFLDDFAPDPDDRDLAARLCSISGSLVVEADENGYTVVHVFSMEDSLHYVEVVVVRDIPLRVTVLAHSDF